MALRMFSLLAFFATLTVSIYADINDFNGCARGSYCVIIDESASINAVEFDLLKQGAKDFVNHMYQHAPGSLFAGVFYSTSPDPISPAWTSSAAVFSSAVDSHSQSGGDTVMESGLLYCKDMLDGAPDPGVAVLFTNGGEDAPLTGASAGGALANAGHKVVTIGVGLEPSDQSVKNIASNPSLAFRIPSFGKISSFIDDILHDLCSVLPNPDGFCGDKCPPAAICFAVDESGSIKKKDFERQADVLAGLISTYEVLAPASLYAGVGYADEAHVIQDLTFDAMAAMNAMLANKQKKGGSASGAGLEMCAALLSVYPGPKTIVLIADGVDNKSPAGTSVDDDIKKNGIAIVTVGIGKENEVGLMNIASPDTGDEYYTSVSMYPVIATKIGPIIEDMCEASAKWKAPTVPNCGIVYCAQCGEMLECYANSGYPSVDAKACAAVSDRRTLCPKKKGKLTKCKQTCSKASGPSVCYPGVSFPPRATNPSCKTRDADGSTLFPENFAKYEACSTRPGKMTIACKEPACDADKVSCYPENLRR